MPVRRLRPAAIAQVRLVSHLQIDHRKRSRPSRCHHVDDHAHHARSIGNVDPCDVQHPALAGESILHVDDYQSRMRQVDIHRRRFRNQFHLE